MKLRWGQDVKIQETDDNDFLQGAIFYCVEGPRSEYCVVVFKNMRRVCGRGVIKKAATIRFSWTFHFYMKFDIFAIIKNVRSCSSGFTILQL